MVQKLDFGRFLRQRKTSLKTDQAEETTTFDFYSLKNLIDVKVTLRQNSLIVFHIFSGATAEIMQ